MDRGFVLAIIAISTIGWVFTTWIRARHGYPIENEWSGTAIAACARRRTQGHVAHQRERAADRPGSRLEERIAVMERIVTDPAERTAREIEALRAKGG